MENTVHICTYSIRVHFPACELLVDPGVEGCKLWNSQNHPFRWTKIFPWFWRWKNGDFYQSSRIESVEDHLKQQFRKTAVRTNIGRLKAWAMTRIDCFNETLNMEGCLMWYQMCVFDVSHPKNWRKYDRISMLLQSHHHEEPQEPSLMWKIPRFLQLLAQTTVDGRNPAPPGMVLKLCK